MAGKRLPRKGSVRCMAWTGWHKAPVARAMSKICSGPHGTFEAVISREKTERSSFLRGMVLYHVKVVDIRRGANKVVDQTSTGNLTLAQDFGANWAEKLARTGRL
jgi:hypothetical protein